MNQDILNFYLEGISKEEIRKRCKVSAGTIKRVLLDGGIPYDHLFNDSKFVKNIISLYKSGKTYSEIAKEESKSPTYIRTLLIERGIASVETPDCTDAQIQEIIRLYETGVSCSKIAKQLNISSTTVKKFVPKEIKKTKQFYNTYSCNYSFFENIDNEVKAYFLGLMYADGCNNIKKKCLQLGFAEKDKELLNKFMEAIESNHKVNVRNRKIGNSQDFYRVTISSPTLSDHLTIQGCVSAKTHLLEKMPELSKELYRHFIRGYFDGDGSVWHSLVGRGTGLNLSLTGNKPFLEKIQAILVQELNIGTPNIYIRHKERNNQIGDLRYAHESARKVLEWLYNDCQYYSERKKSIFLKEKFDEVLI